MTRRDLQALEAMLTALQKQIAPLPVDSPERFGTAVRMSVIRNAIAAMEVAADHGFLNFEAEPAVN